MERRSAEGPRRPAKGTEDLLKVFWGQDLRQFFYEKKAFYRSFRNRIPPTDLLWKEDLLQVFKRQKNFFMHSGDRGYFSELLGT